MRKIPGLVLIMTLLLWAGLLQAATVSHLYDASVPVAQHGQKPAQTLLTQMLQQVLVRVSGNSNVADQDAIAAALKTPQQYVQQYAYNHKNKKWLLNVQFDAGSIQQLLRQAQQPIWGSNRPLTLVWLVTKANANAKAQIINNTADNPLELSLEKVASLRGLPLILPMLDLTDMQALTADQLCSNDWPQIMTASKRYMPDAVLVVTVDNSDPSAINSHWQLQVAGQQFQWDVTGADDQTIAQQGIDDVADAIAKQYAVLENDDSQAQVGLQISGLKSAEDYATINRYLKSLTGVSEVNIVSINGDTAGFAIKTSGNEQSLAKQIGLGHVLLPASTDQSQPQGLMFNYNKR